LVLARYREVLREPHVARLLLTAQVARLPQGMSGLAILLLLSGQVGYGKAGAATGVSVATAGVSNVLLARAVDRIGARRVLAPAALCYALAMGSLAALEHGGYPAQLLVCAVIGLVTPPISSVSRGLWPRLLGLERAQVIYGLEATAQELIFIAGPAAVALIAGLASARAAVLTTGVVGLAGALSYVAAPPFSATERATTPERQSVLFGTGVFWYALVGVCLTLGFNMTDIATVDFVSGRKASAAAGVVLAVWSAGSLLGGVRFGAASSRTTDQVLARIVAVAALGLALCAAAPGAVGLAVVLFVGGAAVAPALARLYTRLGAVAPPGATTETFGWLAVGFLIGSSAGASIGGVSVDTLGPRPTFVLAGAAALLSLAAIAAGSKRARRTARHR
jgi:predicted MFS family arabinose efflux permease